MGYMGKDMEHVGEPMVTRQPNSTAWHSVPCTLLHHCSQNSTGYVEVLCINNQPRH